ncbi:MAG: hypothetical protein EA426_11215 [Spirochaetaceae bacterium]|nr:MAG: hypothetical protein EA426_11215 [Spirochaetaceae bacterium]
MAFQPKIVVPFGKDGDHGCRRKVASSHGKSYHADAPFMLNLAKQWLAFAERDLKDDREAEPPQ